MSKFIDEAKITVRSGDGGNGCLSFRREKYVPKGGPNGGDGGRGGDVIIVADENISSLLDFKYKRYYRAQRGEHGKGKNQHGKDAPDLYIPVPVGTIIKESSSGKVLADLTKDGQKFIVAKGGKGGRGNARFATPTNQAPRYAEPGKKGKEVEIILELKLLADVGIIGFPNAGKSTLISCISAAKPKIADYPFTTLIPNLGVVTYGEGESFVIADIPGIIEGAHRGTGLGIRFLKHVERTDLLLHLIDISPHTERDPVEDYEILNQELSKFSKELSIKPQIVVLNKIDITEAKEILPEIKARFKEKGIEVSEISAAEGKGTKELVYRIAHELKKIREKDDKEKETPYWTFSEEISERGTGIGEA